MLPGGITRYQATGIELKTNHRITMLELIPTGGLCNKMRAIDSAVSFCEAYDLPLKIYWIKDENLINCRFRDVFEPLKNLRVYELDNLPFRFRKGRVRNLFLPNVLQKMPWAGKIFDRFEIKDFKNRGGDFKELYDEYQRLVFFSFSRFFSPEKKYSIFKPLPIVEQMIEQESRAFNSSTIGIHIRRTDHEVAIEKSPLELFERRIEEEMERDARANFYLASDCSDTKRHLVKKYGDVICTSYDPGDRTTLTGMYRGVTELYALSKTSKILGSFGSSYSRTASEINGAELTYVKQSKINGQH